MSDIKSSPVQATNQYSKIKELNAQNLPSAETTKSFDSFLSSGPSPAPTALGGLVNTTIQSAHSAALTSLQAMSGKDISEIQQLEAVGKAQEDLQKFKALWEKTIQAIQDLNRSTM